MMHNKLMIQADYFKVDIDLEYNDNAKMKYHFGDSCEINFHASAMGIDPISAMLESIKMLEYFGAFKYVLHGYLHGKMRFDARIQSDTLEIVIEVHNSDDGETDIRRWFVAIPYNRYKKGVVDAALTTLRMYGVNGFSKNCGIIGGTYFIGNLISILTDEDCIRVDKEDDERFYHSNIESELGVLLKHLKQS